MLTESDKRTRWNNERELGLGSRLAAASSAHKTSFV